MSSPAGYKTWNAGDILQATELMTYLMDQVITVHAGTAAAGSAIPSPAEGQWRFLKDTDALEYYDGSSWVAFSGGGSGGAFSKHFLLMGA